MVLVVAWHRFQDLALLLVAVQRWASHRALRAVSGEAGAQQKWEGGYSSPQSSTPLFLTWSLVLCLPSLLVPGPSFPLALLQCCIFPTDHMKTWWKILTGGREVVYQEKESSCTSLFIFIQNDSNHFFGATPSFQDYIQLSVYRENHGMFYRSIKNKMEHSIP